MNKLIYLSFFSISFAINGQVKNTYYMNDVNTVEYLTLNFCVDDNGKTSDVRIVEEYSTYQNQDFINKVVEYRKGIEYSPDTKLKNNCYDQVFEFVNPKYEKKIISKEDCEKCKMYHKGKYQYVSPKYADVKISRRKNRQVEKSEEYKSIYQINWITDCEYKLTYLSVSKEQYQYLIGETINVKIIDVLQNGNYIYEANLLDRTIVTGEMIKL